MSDINAILAEKRKKAMSILVFPVIAELIVMTPPAPGTQIPLEALLTDDGVGEGELGKYPPQL